jgi:hypothetical protein
MRNATELSLHTAVPGHVVSTISIPYPLNWNRSYETKVFPADGYRITDFSELDAAGYDTEDEAKDGHEAMVRRWKRKLARRRRIAQ